MAIPADGSNGYEGSVAESPWAELARHLGAEYDIGSPTAWKVTTVVGLDRTVQVAPGVGYGHGVRDNNTGPVNIQLPVVTTGTRWDLIVARRDWTPGPTPGGLTTFTSVQGTAVRQIPAGRLVVPGQKDDQMLALVQVTAGQTAPTAIVDLRYPAAKVLTVPELLAAPTRFGTVVRVGDTEFHRKPDATGNLAWIPTHPLHSSRVDALGNTDHPDATARAITPTLQRSCPTGRVQLLVHALGSASAAGISGQVTVQVDGVDSEHSAVAPFAVVGGPGQQTMPISVTQDVAPGTHAFRLVARRRAGTGVFSVPAATLSILDVRK